MCGRTVAGDMTQAQMLEILRGFLNTPPRAEDAPPHATGYNIKPTNQVQMAIGAGDETLLTTAHWGFKVPWTPRPLINAQIDDVKKTFMPAWQSKARCAIPAIGYYEWTGPKTNRLPWFIRPKTNQPCFFVAGLHSHMPDGLRTCTILTRPALPQLEHLHPRVPVILSNDEVGPWISGEIENEQAQRSLGTGWDGRFEFHRVKKILRDDDGPELIEEIVE